MDILNLGMMASEKLGLAYVRRVETRFLQEHHSDTYEKFKLLLKQFGMRNIPSSYVVVTIKKLFQKHPDLLLDFQAFVPTKYSTASAAAAADQADSVDFLNRVATRFSGNNGVYRQFLGLMVSYSNGEYTFSQVRNKGVRLLVKHRDLASEFVSFLPESESSNVNSAGNNNTGVRVSRKRKEEDGGDDDRATAPSQKRVKAEADFELEDSLCDVDIHISNLRSTYKHAVKLGGRITNGSLSPGEARIEEHFTPLMLACIRRVCKENRVREENILRGIPELLRVMRKKMDALKRSRVRLASKMKHYLRRLHNSSH